jgi:Tfp pilus assembly protein PilX
MFPQFKKLNNESGVVLFIVLMVAIVIMIFSVGILTQSMNEMNYAQHQIDQINAQEQTMGAFANTYSTLVENPSTTVGGTVVYNGAVTNVVISTGATNAITGITSYQMNAAYN